VEVQPQELQIQAAVVVVVKPQTMLEALAVAVS
jgi:hypothetical protein